MDKNTFIFDIPMQGAPMDGVEVKQGGECVYGMYCNWTVLDEGYLGLRGYKWVKTRMNAPFVFVCRLAVMKGSGDF